MNSEDSLLNPTIIRRGVQLQPGVRTGERYRQRANGTGYVWPIQPGAATARQRVLIASMTAGASGPASSGLALSAQRPGFVVPTIAVDTPGCARVKRSAIEMASGRGSC